MSQPRKIIYKDDVSESESAAEEEDDDSDFGAKKTPKKSPKKKAATPKKGKKVVSKKKTPAKVTKFLIDSIVRFVNECTQTCTSPTYSLCNNHICYFDLLSRRKTQPAAI